MVAREAKRGSVVLKREANYVFVCSQNPVHENVNLFAVHA